VDEVKAFESDVDSYFESKLEKGRQIIDVEPSATVATTKIQPSEPDEPKEGEHLFHSRIWVTTLYCTSSLIVIAGRTSS
jgi:hypothetical protein